MMPDSPTTPSPLTPLQQGMLYSWLQDPRAGVDLEQLVCTLDEAVDAPRLRAAWEAVVAAHPMLRSYFDTAAAEPAQRVLPSVETPWAEEDWSAFSEEERKTKLEAFLEEDRALGFDLAAAPLLRFRLFYFGNERHVLVWTFHHILLDGRAITALVREAFDRAAGRPVRQPAATFAEHAAWLKGVDHTPSTEFWKNALSGVSGPTPLVVNGLKGTRSDNLQDEADLVMTRAETDALRAFAEAHGLTLNTLTQGAWALLLARYSGESRVVFGATRACRHTPVPGSAEIAGLLINTLPVRVELPDEASLVPWLQDLRRLWVDMRPHEHTPLSHIRRVCGMPATQVPFQHLLVFENDDYTGSLRASGGPEWQNRSLHLRELTSVPLTLAVYGGAEMRLHCAFRPSQFDPATVSRMLGHVAELLRGMAAAAPDATLRSLEMITAAERRLLTVDCQPADPGVPSDDTLHGWFSEAARRFAHRIAVTAEDASWTYAELDRRSNAIARALTARGVKSGDFVGICMERRAPLIAALLGILKAGGAYLPIDLAYPPERLAFMLEDAAAPVLLTEKALASKIPGRTDCVLYVEDIPEPDASTGADLDVTGHSADGLAYIIYTSGSTGLPKGCQITHRNVVRLMRATEAWYGFDENDVWTLFHSTAFDFSVWELWGALLYGGRLVVTPWLTTRSPDEFFRLLCEERVTVLNQTPSAFRQLIQAEPLARAAHPGLPPQSLRYVIFGGEALEMGSLKPWYDRHGDTAPRLVNMYGITETTVHVTYRPLSAEDLTSGSVIGEPIPDLRLFILDPVSRQPVPVGVPGEMYVGGAGLAVGYLRRPELTADRFLPNHLTGEGRLYKTGDLARFIPGPDADNPTSLDIEYLGRIDLQVKIRGFRIELGEIENVLTSHPLVLEAAVLAREDRPGDKRLCAYLVTGAEKPTPADLRALLNTRVPDYMVPAAFVFLDKFPITTNGKLDRKALPAPATDGPVAARAHIPPSTPAEQTLADIWAAVLRLERVGADDNFFEIGGDSILSIQVIARAREAGLALSPRQLFENPTVASLAAVAMPVTRPNSKADDPAAPFPASPVQEWFFAQNLEDSHHWNQAFLFTLSERPNPETLRSVLGRVIAHHSALRLRFRRENGAWIPSIALEEKADILTFRSGEEYSEAACVAAQTSLNYETGPMLRAVCFDAGEDRPGRLFLAVHHLAIDGVSWRILLEDLETALAGKPLPAATDSWPRWARQVKAWAQSPEGRAQAAYWDSIPPAPAAPVTREADAFTRTVVLSEESTTALLHRVPSAWRTRINDVLLTALTLAHHRITGDLRLTLNLEGHGREEAISGGLALDRTIGWFTAIFPASLSIPAATPEAALPAVKEQLRGVPDHGAGYLPLATAAEYSARPANMVFNYLGQLDALTAGSELLAFAPESGGPWHAPAATRAHAMEINAMVIRGRLETAFTAAAPAHTPEETERFANAFLECLREVIDHCLSVTVPRATPSDFPLAALDQEALDGLLLEFPGLTDICRLTPMQRLFHNAALTKPNAGFDQWTCRVKGPLDKAALREAWTATVRRHAILRSTFHTAGLPHAVMVTHEGIDPEWTETDVADAEEARRFLATDAARVNDLTRPLCGRFTLLRLTEDDHLFLWSVPDLQLDGWSWPIVFGEAASLYRARTSGETAALPHPRPYRDHIAWLAQQSEEGADGFWESYLDGVEAPTPIPADTVPGPRASRRTREARASLSKEECAVVTEAARRSGVTAGVMIQSAWALLLAHGAGVSDVIQGSAFSGRPADLPGADRIVGPFVNNLPVRIKAAPAATGAELLRLTHGVLTDLAARQFTPLPRVQDCSSVPWRFRLFESLVVFQNYQIDPSLARLGPATALEDFNGPIHTNYPLTLVVTPGVDTWELLLVYQEAACSDARAADLLRDFTALLLGLARKPEASVSELQQLCGIARGSSPAQAAAQRPDIAPAAPRTSMEHRLAAIWKRAFGLSEISVNDNFFDLGGHSLLMMRVHGAVCQETGRALPVVTLFQYPTIAALAAHLEPPVSAAPSATASALKTQTAGRAAAARAAAARAAAVRGR